MSSTNENILNKIEVGIDKYDIQETWIQNIAAKYLDVEDINHLKVGLFGYLNEIMATSIRSGIAHRNFLYDEAFLNTASMTKSIYNKAKSYNYDIPTATPSSLRLLLSIQQSAIVDYGEPQVDSLTEAYTGDYILTLSGDNEFYVGAYPFRVEADIIITAKLISSKIVDGSAVNTYAYSAKYDYSTSKDTQGLFSGNTSAYISTWVDRDDELDDIITLDVTAYQVSKTSTTFENFSSDLSDNLFFNIDYKNNLAKFIVHYRTQTIDTILEDYFNDAFTPDDDYYCYYSFDNSQLTIYFSGLPDNFKPAINSSIEVEVYTTLGSSGNFSYDGTINYKFNDTKLQNKIGYSVTKLTNPSGGSNTPSKLDIKQELINEFLTRDNLITEYDLNSYFNQLIKADLVNSSNMLFIKKRDDLFKRCFAVFLLLRDSNGLIIPTNTINLDYITDPDLEFTLSSGTEICYDDNQYIILTDNTRYFINSLKDRLNKILTNDDKLQVEYEDDVNGLVTEDMLVQAYEEEDYLNSADEEINDEVADVVDILDESYAKEIETSNELSNHEIIDENFDENYIDQTFEKYEFLNDTYSYIKYNPKFDTLTFTETDENGKTTTKSFKEKLLECADDEITEDEIITGKGYYRPVELDEDTSNFKLLYKLPFAIYYKMSPIQRVLIVRNTIDYDMYFNYDYINSVVSYEFIINSMNIQRNSISFDRTLSDTQITDPDDNSRVIRTIITTNDIQTKTTEYIYNQQGVLLQEPEVVDVQDSNVLNTYNLSFTLNTTMNNLDVLDGGNVLIRCLIKDTDGDYQGYFDFTVEDEKVLVYSKALVTNDIIDSHNRLCITNSIYSLEEKYTYDELGSIVDTYIPAKDTANEEDAVDEFYIDESVDIEVCILIKDVKYGQVLPDVLGKMEDLRSEYSLAVKFVNSGLKFSLFTVLNDVINPTLVYRPSTYTEGGVQIQSMPVIGSHYFKTYETYMNFFDIFSIYYDVLTANFEKLENNTSLDLKFYNTYGYSKYFSSYSTNITLNIVIKLSGTFSNTLDLSIKNYIVAFVEEINNSTTKNLAISNLMRGLEKNFTEIEYVELESLDGLDPSIQVIESASSDVSDMSREQLINYIPEFLNIDMKEEAYIYGADNFQTGITITYK